MSSPLLTLVDFYPRPPRGGRPYNGSMFTKSFEISIHALREEGDRLTRSKTSSTTYFYPRPPRGGRRTRRPMVPRPPNFYPRPPRGGRPASVGFAVAVFLFLSTPSARRATIPIVCPCFLVAISIHALREEGDLPGRAYGLIYNISIHALREEGDVAKSYSGLFEQQFLSTPSARRATTI